MVANKIALRRQKSLEKQRNRLGVFACSAWHLAMKLFNNQQPSIYTVIFGEQELESKIRKDHYGP